MRGLPLKQAGSVALLAAAADPVLKDWVDSNETAALIKAHKQGKMGVGTKWQNAVPPSKRQAVLDSTLSPAARTVMRNMENAASGDATLIDVRAEEIVSLRPPKDATPEDQASYQSIKRALISYVSQHDGVVKYDAAVPGFKNFGKKISLYLEASLPDTDNTALSELWSNGVFFNDGLETARLPKAMYTVPAKFRSRRATEPKLSDHLTTVHTDLKGNNQIMVVLTVPSSAETEDSELLCMDFATPTRNLVAAMDVLHNAIDTDSTLSYDDFETFAFSAGDDRYFGRSTNRCKVNGVGVQVMMPGMQDLHFNQFPGDPVVGNGLVLLVYELPSALKKTETYMQDAAPYGQVTGGYPHPSGVSPAAAASWVAFATGGIAGYNKQREHFYAHSKDKNAEYVTLLEESRQPARNAFEAQMDPNRGWLTDVCT